MSWVGPDDADADFDVVELLALDAGEAAQPNRPNARTKLAAVTAKYRANVFCISDPP